MKRKKQSTKQKQRVSDINTNQINNSNGNEDLKTLYKQLHQIKLEKITETFELFKKWR